MSHSFKAIPIIILAIAGVTLIYKLEVPAVNHTTIALTYLLISLVAGTYGLWPGILASIASGFCFNFFFLPPVGILAIHDPQNWVALIVFMITALTANHLASAARRRAKESERRREEVSKLFEVSRVIILTPDPYTASAVLAQQLVQIFAFSGCFIAVRTEKGTWNIIAQEATDPGQIRLPVSDLALQEVYETGRLKQVERSPHEIATCVPLRKGEKVMGVLVCVSDKTEPATMEAVAGLVALAMERERMLHELNETEALKQSDQLKSAILASVSHDLRTPLTAIRAAVDNLLSADVNWDEALKNEFYAIIKEEVDRLSQLVQNLLEMARIDAGECRPVKEWGSVSEMITDVIARCSDSLAHHQVKINISENMPMVRWDERLMSQVVANLLENAGQYSPPGTEVVLAAELKHQRLFVHVQDQGSGISAEELPRIFERFYRGRSTDGKGTGMGLAIARGIMEAHGGSIRVRSSTGIGSIFTIEVPVETKIT